MAIVSYGTITITDTNDIESIVVEYNRNQSTTTPPEQNDLGWSTTRPAWASGYYIWQRTRTHKSGTQATSDIIGNAVCITGATGQKGDALEISSVKYAISEENSFVDEEPYTFRSSLGGNRLKDKLVGGAVTWNQLATASSSSGGGITVTVTNGHVVITGTPEQTGWYSSGSANAIKDHIYYITVTDYKENDEGSKLCLLGNYTQLNNFTTQKQAIIVKNTSAYSIYRFAFSRNTSVTYNKEYTPQLFDLTQMFGSTIANYIYSLETATAGAGVAWFRKLFPKPYYAYNAGELKSVSGVSAHNMRGFNAWDEEWEVGGIDADTGANISASSTIRSKNYMPIVGGITYYCKIVGFSTSTNFRARFYDADKNYIGYVQKNGSNVTCNSSFVAPDNAVFMRFATPNDYGATYKNDICINLFWDGSRNGEYEPYVKHSYPLDDSLTLRGIPKLDSSNNLYYDGDTYESDGTVTRKYGIVGMGSLDWSYYGSATPKYFEAYVNNPAPAKAITANIICSKYPAKITSGTAGQEDKTISWSGNSTRVFIVDSAYTDAQTFKTAMNGVYLVYELATPTTETADPYTNPQIVNDFGTEEYVTDSLLPVGHSTEYFTGTTDQPADSDFTYNEPPNVKDGQWLWVRTTYSDNTKVYLKTRQGVEGLPGTAGRGIIDVETLYATNNSTTTAPTSGWQTQPPTYDSSKPKYWVKVTTTYDSGDPTIVTYLDNGITDAMSTAAAANSTANTANQNASTALTNANTALTNANNALSIANGTKQWFWVQATDYSTAIPAGTYVTQIGEISFKSSPSGGNVLTRSDGIYLRNGGVTLGSLTGTALTFYKPNTTNKGMELTTSALTFYNPSSNAAQLIIGANGTLQSGNFVYTSGTYADSGTKIDLTNGSIYTPGFRTDGSNTYIRGEINALSGQIGNNGSNYWTIGNNYNYDQTASAALISHGTAFIQLDTSNTWRLSTDRIHTAWNGTDSSAALMFPKDGNTYWDWGIHSPHQTDGVWKDKFVYARKYTNTTDDDFTNRDNLTNDIDDNLGFWKYQFYIDKNGSIYARNFYLLNEDGTPGSNIGGQDAVYLLKSGGTITGNLEVNGTLTKSSKNVAYLTATPTSGQILIADGTSGGIKTSGYTIAKSIPSNALFTDENVKSTEANTTKLWLVGSDTSGTRTGALKYDSGVYITTTAGTLHATTFEGALSGTASRATADADGNTIKTTYLKLSGGNVTGAVTFGSSVSVDELTTGDLAVNGNASFTNNLQANTINGVAVGSSPKFTDTNYYHTTGSWGGTNNLTYTATANGGAGALAFTLATATTGVYGVTKLSSATDSNSTTLAATASAVKAAYDLAASKTDNTGTVTSVRVQASSPLQSSSSAVSSTTLDTTISFANQNVNTILAGPSSGTTAATPTFRKLVAADIPDISGTYYLASNPSGYTTNTGTVTSVRVQASSPLTSTTNTVSSTTLDTTIKFSNQNKNLVLAGPSSGNAAAPTFRSLVADDIPSISKSKISDFPTSLKNPNAIRLNLFNETTARAAANQGTATSYVDYDGSTTNQTFSAAGKNAITSIGISGDTLSWIRADGSSGSSTVTITASVASGATVLTDTNGNAISTTGSTTPIYFDSGVPKDVTGIAFSLLPTGTGASNVAVGNHSHGNITNGGDITTTATIASGDRLVINDESEGKINNSSITFGTSTTTFLSNKGTWETPAAAGSATNATNDSDGNPINTTYLKRSGGTMTGELNFATIASWPTAEGETYPIESKGISWSGSSDGARIYYRVDGSDKGNLIIQTADDANTSVIFRTTTSNGDSIILNADGKQIYPTVNNSGSLGLSTNKWANVYATTFNGALSGNATSATKANLTTTTNAVAYYTDTAGTFGSKASANGALYATSTNGALNWGTLPIAQGGTGATSAVNATWNLLHVADPGDLNTAKRGGSFKISNTTTNTPVASMWGATINITDDSAGGNNGTSGSTWQIVLQSANNNMWLRCITNTGSWSDYAKFYTTSNKPTKSDVGLGNVENKSSATIRGELTSSNVTTALGYTPVNKAGDTMSGILALKPASGEGGQLELRASTANTTQAGIALDQLNSTFRIFGIASADGTTKTGTGTPLVIDPYGKTITGGYTITGTLSGNATTATTLQTARTIFGKSFNGSANVAGQALVYGDYTATASSRYAHGGIQIREQDLVGSAQSDILYAPTIGFHWSGRIAASLIFHSDGIFYLRKQDGVTRATLDANLNGNAATATKATQDGSGNTITSKYVTIDTNQTITAAQKTFNGATRWSITNSTTGSKYGACNYDATLDALVFSFGTI